MSEREFPWRHAQDACRDCYFFEPMKGQSGLGQCLRYPTVARKSETAWCGEYRQAAALAQAQMAVPEKPKAKREGDA